MTPTSITAEDARLGMCGRILRCPLGDNPEDCPLYEIRKLPIEERVEWLNARTDEEVTELFALHSKCLEEKLA